MSREIENKSINKLMKICPSYPKQSHTFTHNPCAPTPPAVIPLFFFAVLTWHATPAAVQMPLKARAVSFFLSLLCLPYKCRSEHYIWNIFKGRLWWFTVLCKHFVFSPAGNQRPLLDLLSLIPSECFCFLCCRAEMGAFESICFALIYFSQSHITLGLILTVFCEQWLPISSLWGEWAFASEMYLVSETTQGLCLQPPNKE